MIKQLKTHLFMLSDLLESEHMEESKLPFESEPAINLYYYFIVMLLLFV